MLLSVIQLRKLSRATLKPALEVGYLKRDCPAWVEAREVDIEYS
jgi:hypothetical protein